MLSCGLDKMVWGNFFAINGCYFLCRNKHHGNYDADDDDSNMEANFDDIMKEEKRRLESLSNFIWECQLKFVIDFFFLYFDYWFCCSSNISHRIVLIKIFHVCFFIEHVRVNRIHALGEWGGNHEGEYWWCACANIPHRKVTLVKKFCFSALKLGVINGRKHFLCGSQGVAYLSYSLGTMLLLTPDFSLFRYTVPESHERKMRSNSAW